MFIRSRSSSVGGIYARILLLKVSICYLDIHSYRNNRFELLFANLTNLISVFETAKTIVKGIKETHFFVIISGPVL